MSKAVRRHNPWVLYCGLVAGACCSTVRKAMVEHCMVCLLMLLLRSLFLQCHGGLEGVLPP